MYLKLTLTKKELSVDSRTDIEENSALWIAIHNVIKGYGYTLTDKDKQDIAAIVDVNSAIDEHNTDVSSHVDIRTLFNSRSGLPTYDDVNYRISFESGNGAKVVIDLPVEQIGMHYDPDTKEMWFINASGEEVRIDLTDFLDIYLGSIGEQIQISISSGNVITATLLSESIKKDNLTLALQAELDGKVNAQGGNASNVTAWQDEEAGPEGFKVYDYGENAENTPWTLAKWLGVIRAKIDRLFTIKLDTTGNGSDTTVNFAEAGVAALPASGEKQATLWGKALMYFKILGENATYKGFALPTTVPGNPNGNVFYIAQKMGVYPNFGGFILQSGFAIFHCNGGTWTYTRIGGYNDFLVDARIKNWSGTDSNILFIDYVYKNDPTYLSGVRVQKTNGDFTNAVQVAYWTGLTGTKTGIEKLTATMPSNLGTIEIVVDWDKIPNAYNAVLDIPILIPKKAIYGSIVDNELSANNYGLLETAGYVKKDEATLSVNNLKVSAISYIHPSGLSEYDGNTNYSIDGIGAYLLPQNKKLLVRKIKGKLYCNNANAIITVSVYKGTTLTANTANLTLVETIVYNPGTFSMLPDNFQNIVLTNDLILQANEYLYVFVTPSVGLVGIKRWTIDAVPTRNKFLLKVSGTWYLSDPPYFATPLMLYSTVNDNDIDIESQIQTIDQRLDVLENIVDTTPIDVSFPTKIYAVVGDTLQMFYRGIVKVVNPYVYDILVTCSKGIQYPRYFQYTPTISDIGETTLTIAVKNNNGDILGQATTTLVTKHAVQSPATEKKVLCVGDSLTTAGTWCIEASRRLIGTGGTPAGLQLNNISFVGRKTREGVGFEGTGGWTWSNYATAGVAAFRFYVSGVVTPPAIGSVYTNNGGTFTVAEINITSGTGNIRCTSVGTPGASGTLTKSSGTGDNTIAFSSSVADSGNPFWYSGALNFTQYVNTYMGGGCDAIYFLLTWNGISANQTDFTGMITTAKVLIDHIHTSFPNCKIKIMGIQVPSINGGMGANYGATGTSYADAFGMAKTALNLNAAYQNWCNESAYNTFMEFVNISSQFDSENNMPESDVAVNTRSSKTEKRGTNGVHPDTPGYYQIGDIVFRNFVCNFCQ